MKPNIDCVHLVEASPYLRKAQAELLAPGKVCESLSDDGIESIYSVCTDEGIEIKWHDSLDSVPQIGPKYIVSHEFFDALPVYKFEVKI